MSAGEMAYGLGRILSRLAPRRADDCGGNGGDAGVASSVPALSVPTKALRKFITSLQSRPDPAVLDLGPVVGQNVSFFGEQLGCKIYIENLFEDLDRHAREKRLEDLSAFLRRRFTQDDETIDGILCWDLLDYLPRPAAASLAAELTRVLRVDGTLLGFFSTARLDVPFFTRYVVVDEDSLEHRRYPGTIVRDGSLANRDIIKLFEGLRVSDSFLLKNHCREILFRKPSYLTRARR